MDSATFSQAARSEETRSRRGRHTGRRPIPGVAAACPPPRGHQGAHVIASLGAASRVTIHHGLPDPLKMALVPADESKAGIWGRHRLGRPRRDNGERAAGWRLLAAPGASAMLLVGLPAGDGAGPGRHPGVLLTAFRAARPDRRCSEESSWGPHGTVRRLSPPLQRPHDRRPAAPAPAPSRPSRQEPRQGHAGPQPPALPGAHGGGEGRCGPLALGLRRELVVFVRPEHVHEVLVRQHRAFRGLHLPRPPPGAAPPRRGPAFRGRRGPPAPARAAQAAVPPRAAGRPCPPGRHQRGAVERWVAGRPAPRHGRRDGA